MSNDVYLRYGLTLSLHRSLSDRNRFIDLLCNLMDWFLYDRGLCCERVNGDEVKAFQF